MIHDIAQAALLIALGFLLGFRHGHSRGQKLGHAEANYRKRYINAIYTQMEADSERHK